MSGQKPSAVRIGQLLRIVLTLLFCLAYNEANVIVALAKAKEGVIRWQKNMPI
jgi:hypothetical protein